MSIFEIILLLAVGFIAGIINTVSAGGSLLTLPVLLFLGLPSAEANGTNRVAIVVQSVTSVVSFARKGQLKIKKNLSLLIASTVGAVFGALSAISISDDVFMIILAMTMIVTLGFIIWNPLKAITKPGRISPTKYAVGTASFVLIGFYSGFIQVGVGFYIMILAILLYKRSFIEATLIKILVVGLSVLISLCIFAVNGHVLWGHGIILATGTAIGALLGSKLVLSSQTKWIQLILIATVILLAARLFYDALL
ncbi:sulfite exporter TauE/SafE family protein [Bacillus sp. JCM 19041]|uniref:sulfite exporter TauE/SafE family protein n=1 Tax=Bacillus sp. JCM 19041 TaxID=1460637 RepID=UPI0006D094EC